MSEMPGHVFVAHGDLAKLRCDAWLLPTDEHFGVRRGWTESLPPPVRTRVREHIAQLRTREVSPPPNWGPFATRVACFPGWPTALPGNPRPYLVDVGRVAGTDVEWYLEGVRQFVAAVRQGQPAHPRQRNYLAGPVTRRPKPLVAVPLVGTGGGGAGGIKGDVVRALLQELQRAAKEHDIDVVLVTHDAPAFAAAQNIRWQAASPNGTDPHSLWPELPPSLVHHAEALASHATDHRLVLFVGAGVGAAAGLPSWDELLDKLAEAARLTERERTALQQLHYLDRPHVIASRLAAGAVALADAVCRQLASDYYSLTHGLLAALPVREVVTTNYDVLFEMASSAAGKAVAVLPYEPVGRRERWLLKLHGSVTHPDDIVLTREDYIRYADRRAALSGIVQALLITRHMLFVGFSLRDDNFHRIIDDVRKAIRGSTRSDASTAQFGTALLLQPDPMLEELWRNDLTIVSAADAPSLSMSEAARRQEIFLDCVLALATRGVSPLLDMAYDGALTEEERTIRRLLQELEMRATPGVRASPAWRPVAQLLRQLGGRG